LKGNSKITPIQPHFVAQNPSLAKQLFGYAILGFALTETIVLFALMMAFKKYIYILKKFGVGILGEINTFLLHPIYKVKIVAPKKSIFLIFQIK
jgi:hypothetical protein